MRVPRRWRDVDLSGTHFAATYGTLARLPWPDHVLVAPRTGPKAARAQEVLAALVEAGLATPPRQRR